MIVNGLFFHPDIRPIPVRWSGPNGLRRVIFRHARFEIRDWREICP